MIKKLICYITLMCLVICSGAGSFSVYAADSGSVDAYANSPTALIVKDINTNRVKKTYTVQDLAKMGVDESYPITDANNSKMVFQKVSARNDANQLTWYGATGVTLEWLPRDLQIWSSFTEVTLQSDDSQWSMFTKEQIADPTGYYFADTNEKQTLVYPMIALWYTETGKNQYTDPPRPEVDETSINENAPRLFVGQQTYNEANSGYMLKNITTVYADFPQDELYKEPPVIRGVPTEPIYLQKGQQFNFPSGVYATDAYGNTVKVERTVKSEDGLADFVDVNTPGTYIITYIAKDSRGNVTTKELRVYVLESGEQKGSYTLNIQKTVGCSVESSGGNIINVSAANNGTASFEVKITPEKRYGSSQNVIFAHYSGNKLVSLTSQTLSINSAKLLNGSFKTNGGDVIKIFVVDSFNASKGSGAFILNSLPN